MWCRFQFPGRANVSPLQAAAKQSGNEDTVRYLPDHEPMLIPRAGAWQCAQAALYIGIGYTIQEKVDHGFVAASFGGRLKRVSLLPPWALTSASGVPAKGGAADEKNPACQPFPQTSIDRMGYIVSSEPLEGKGEEEEGERGGPSLP